MVLEAKRHLLADKGKDRFQSLPVDMIQRGFHRAHAAADIDPNRVGNDDVFRGGNTADWHAVADMGIGHDGDVAVDSRQVGQVFRLLQRVGVKLGQPELDRALLGCDRLFHEGHRLRWQCTISVS